MSELIKGIDPGTGLAVPVAVDEDGHLQVDIGGATIDAEVTVGAVVTVTGGEDQTADVLVSLDGEAVGLKAGTAQIGHVITDPTSVAGIYGAAKGTTESAQPTVSPVDDNHDALDVVVLGEVTLAEAVTLAAGTAAIGKLAANDGVDIGDVDVKSIAAGTNLIGKVSIDQVSAGGNHVEVIAAPIPTLGQTIAAKRVALTAGQTGIVVWDPAGGKAVNLAKLVISCAVGGTVQLYFATNTSANAVGPVFYVPANATGSESWRLEAPRTGAADAVLYADTSASFVGSAYVEGWEAS